MFDPGTFGLEVVIIRVLTNRPYEWKFGFLLWNKYA